MSKFDPYHKWLGIPPEEQPANLYRLLGLQLFESDRDTISAAAEQRMQFVQKAAVGQHFAESQQILNILAKAKITLLNTNKKITYDESLRRQSNKTAEVPPGNNGESSTARKINKAKPVPEIDSHSFIRERFEEGDYTSVINRAQSITNDEMTDETQEFIRESLRINQLIFDVRTNLNEKASSQQLAQCRDQLRELYLHSPSSALIFSLVLEYEELTGKVLCAPQILEKQDSERKSKRLVVTTTAILFLVIAAGGVTFFLLNNDSLNLEASAEEKLVSNEKKSDTKATQLTSPAEHISAVSVPEKMSANSSASTGSQADSALNSLSDTEDIKLPYLPTQKINEEVKFELRIPLESGNPIGPSHRLRLGEGAPDGVGIDERMGTLTWTPTEEQGPGAYEIPLDLMNESLKVLDSKKLTIEVVEVNRRPSIANIEDQEVVAGVDLSIPIQISDDGGAKNLVIQASQDGSPENLYNKVSNSIVLKDISEGIHTVSLEVVDQGRPPLSSSLKLRIVATKKVILPAPKIISTTKHLVMPPGEATRSFALSWSAVNGTTKYLFEANTCDRFGSEWDTQHITIAEFSRDFTDSSYDLFRRKLRMRTETASSLYAWFHHPSIKQPSAVRSTKFEALYHMSEVQRDADSNILEFPAFRDSHNSFSESWNIVHRTQVNNSNGLTMFRWRVRAIDVYGGLGQPSDWQVVLFGGFAKKNLSFWQAQSTRLKTWNDKAIENIDAPTGKWWGR